MHLRPLTREGCGSSTKITLNVVVKIEAVHPGDQRDSQTAEISAGGRKRHASGEL